MVDDIKNYRFELEEKSDQGYSSMEISEPKAAAAEPEQVLEAAHEEPVEAAHEEPVEAAHEEPVEAAEETTTSDSQETSDSPSSNDDADFDEKHDHK